MAPHTPAATGRASIVAVLLMGALLAAGPLRQEWALPLLDVIVWAITIPALSALVLLRWTPDHAEPILGFGQGLPTGFRYGARVFVALTLVAYGWPGTAFVFVLGVMARVSALHALKSRRERRVNPPHVF